MKLLSLLAVLFMGACTTTVAQESKLKIAPAAMPCNEWQIVVHNLKDYEEIPIAQGDVAVQLLDGTDLSGQLVIFVNPKTYTYTITMRTGSEDTSLTCVLGAGVKFSPAVDDDLTLLRGGTKT